MSSVATAFTTVVRVTPTRTAMLSRTGHTRHHNTFVETARVSARRPQSLLFSSTARIGDEVPVSSGATDGVYAKAKIVDRLMSKDGKFGILSVLVSDEATSSTKITQPVVPEVSMGIPVPTMMTKQPKPTTSKAHKQGDDMLGKVVKFSNSNHDDVVNVNMKGMVIAHRYPLAFVYVAATAAAASNASASADAVVTLSGVEDGDPVQILKKNTNIHPVQQHVLGKVVDCFGDEIIMKMNSSIAGQTGTETEIDATENGRPIFSPIPLVADISLINRPLLTGVPFIDELAPIGKGQNMLMVGQEPQNDGRRKRHLVQVALEMQRLEATMGRPVKCVYAATGTGTETVLPQMTHNDFTVVTNRVSNDDAIVKAAESVAVCAAACSIGEFYSRFANDHDDDGNDDQQDNDGHDSDALVIIDTVDPLKVFWDYTTRVLMNVYGKDAVVKEDASGAAGSESRAFFSSLIQRAGSFKTNTKKVEGSKDKQHQTQSSLTLLILATLPNDDAGPADGEDAVLFTPQDFEGYNPKLKVRIQMLIDKGIPVTTAILNKLEIPIPPTKESSPSQSQYDRVSVLRHVDELMSMTDGQLWLLDDNENDNGNESQSIALDVRRSVTRVGVGADTDSRADAPALRDLIGGLRFDFAQALALEGGADIKNDKNAQKQLLRRDALLLALHQGGAGGGSNDSDHTPKRLSQQCVGLLAARSGTFDNAIQQGHGAGTKEGSQLVSDLMAHLTKKTNKSNDILERIDATLDLSAEDRASLEAEIKLFSQQ
jgi:F0F1-type ATP synthase alpha subunit